MVFWAPKKSRTIFKDGPGAGEALAVLEGVADEGLLRLEAALGHLVGLQGVRVLQDKKP